MKNAILKDWTFMRVLRLALGVFIIAQAMQTNEWLLVVFGGLFSLMSLLNIGCCGSAGCTIPPSIADKKIEGITYEEVR